MANSRLVNRLLRVVGVVLIALCGVMSFTSTASASTSESEYGLRGTLSVGAGNAKTPVEGVTITVTDDSGSEVGSSVTDADGNWSVPVPAEGAYTVTLDEGTLPDGITIAEGKTNSRDITFTKPGTKGALFALDDGVAVEAQQSVNRVIQLTVDGLKFGLIIAMCSVGLSLIYGTTGLVNFAHGEMVTFGAFVAFVINNQLGLPGIFGSLIFGAVVAVLMSGLAGGLFNATVWKPMRQRGSSLIAGLVVSIGFSITFRYILVIIFGSRSLKFRDYQIQQKVYFGDLFGLPPKEIVVMVLSIIVLIGVALGLERTRAGKAMRAVADNRDLAESSGIDVEGVIRWVWVFGGALAGLGGVFFGVTEAIGWEMGFRILLLMFAGITLGGLGTAYGALVGSIIIGLMIQLSTLFGVPADMKNVPALVLMILILLFRPQGLFGRAERIG